MAETPTTANDPGTATISSPAGGAAASAAPVTGAGEETAERTRPLSARAKPDKGGFFGGTGRRKTAVARVRIRPLSDQSPASFKVNGKEVDDFFSEIRDREACHAPLQATGMEGKVEVHAKVHGGGMTAQADSVLLGVARALKGYDPTLEDRLRDEGHLTRDAREVERKKYAQPGARRKFQFSKR